MSIIKSNMTAPPPSGGALSSISEMNSLRFDGSSYLQKNNFGTSAGTVNTFSWWLKLSDLSDTRVTIFGAWYNTADLDLGIGATGYGAPNTLRGNWGGGANYNLHYINNKLRDTSAWYHIVVSFNSSNSSGNKIKAYINGTQITATTSSDPTYTSFGRNNSTCRIGARVDGSGYAVAQQFKGYLANIHFIDGQALTPHYFGANVSGVWVPKEFDGTSSDSTYAVSTESSAYGTNGFHLDFADSGNIGNDVSGRNNHWTVN